MAGHYSDNDNTHNESVQDYLDLLLTHATEKPETQVDVINEVEQHDAELNKSSELSSVNNIALFSARAGTRIAARSAAPSIPPIQDSPHASAQSTPQTTQPQSVKPTLKPYAEPVRPMPLRAPVMPSLKKAEPQLKTETPVRTRTQVQAPSGFAEQDVKVQPVVKARPEPVALEPARVKPAPPVPEPPGPPVEEQPETANVETVNAEAVNAETRQTDQGKTFATTEWLNGRPSWAQGRFECLLFSVGGLTLAVPLVELGTIYPMNEELTPIFGQADWFMGLLTVKDSNLKTIDTAKVVMPERYQPAMAENYGFVISINGMSWGLAVDSVANAILLEPSDVKWRSERSKRPWLAGTVVEQMCALVDVSQLAALFEASGKRRNRPGS